MGPYGSSRAARPASGRTTPPAGGSDSPRTRVHGQVRARERVGRGHGAAPVGRVVLAARAHMVFVFNLLLRV